MKQELKRPNQTYLLNAGWIVFLIYSSTINSTTIGIWSLRLLAFAAIISFIHKTIKRNYMEIYDDKLLINRDFFRKTLIKLNQIEKIKIESGPLSSSRIFLKDNSSIKFSDDQLSTRDLKEVMSQYKIPVD